VRVNMERKKSKRPEEAERKVAIEKPELKDWEAVKSDLWAPRRLLSEIFVSTPLFFLFKTFAAAVSLFSLSKSISQKAQTKWKGALANSKSSKLPLISFYSYYPALFNTFMFSILITVLYGPCIEA
jgi:hypothetical protein